MNLPSVRHSLLFGAAPAISVLPTATNILSLVPASRKREVERLPDLSEVGPDEDGVTVAPQQLLNDVGQKASTLRSRFPKPTLGPHATGAGARSSTDPLMQLVLADAMFPRPTSGALKSVVKEHRSRQASSLARRMAVSDSLMGSDMNERVDPPVEYLPEHLREAAEKEERFPFCGPVEIEKQLADEAMRSAEVYPFPGDATYYTVQDVGWWLAKVGFAQYRSLFAVAGITGEILLLISPSQVLTAVGVTDRAHVNKIVAAR